MTGRVRERSAALVTLALVAVALGVTSCRAVGPVSSTVTCATRAPEGPRRSAISKRSSAWSSPSACDSTRPSGKLTTKPCRPSRRAASSVKNRKPTPCTRPLTRNRLATRIRPF